MAATGTDWTGGDGSGLGTVNNQSNVEGDFNDGNGNFTGDIAIFRFYESALTSTEVTANYESIAGESQVIEVNGSSASVGSEVTLASGALLTMNADGSFSYDPNGQFDYLMASESTTDDFAYTYDDGAGSTDTATVSITINGVDDAIDTTTIGNTVTFTEDAGATSALFAASIDTIEAGDTITQVVLTLANIEVGDTLSFGATDIDLNSNGATVASGFTYTVTGAGATPVVTITHAGADDATVNTMLNSAVFNNTTNNAPSTTARTVTFTSITDSGSDTTADGTVATINVTTVNDAPSFGDENSPTTFYDHTIATGSDFRNVYSNIFSIDLNQDGYIDVLANTWRWGELVWFENDNGTGNFIEHNIDMPGANGLFTDIYSADINNDTYLDLVVATDSQLSWLENDGSQNFSWHLVDSLGDGLSSVSATDFDGDGHMEIVYASSNDDTIAWYKNNNEVFTRNVLTSTAEGAATVVTADVDSDGNTDIVYASSDDDTIAWYQYLGGNVFSTENIVTTTSDGAYGVTVADMDSDGHMDLVVTAARVDDFAIELYENNDDQTFTKHIIGNKVTNPTVWPVATGDFDNDGDLDVIAPFPELDQMSWYENTGGHSYTEHMFTQNVYGARSIAVADINDDGKLDVLSASYFDQKIAWHENVTTTLDGVPDYTEDDPPVVLDADVEIFDAELSALDNFDGSSLTLVRDGGTNGDDLFSATGTLVDLTEGVSLEVDSTVIGTVTTNTGGTLRLDFDSNATRSLVNSAMQQIAYSNSSD
ncbi:MAG: hypothetical protein GY697_27630, partial [Desulfobacterales bacterium]|nr:hypothetical protein [Desulfobacterales bacterium]